MVHVSPDRPVVGIDAYELHCFAEVVAALLTQKAIVAGNARLDRNSVAWDVRVSARFRDDNAAANRLGRS
jgi:hypothetical protein